MSTSALDCDAAAAERPGLTAADFGLLILRLGLGIIFVAHGSQKVLGIFGGPGLAGTVQFMGKMGIPAPLAYLASFTEFLGGLAVLGGLLLRLACVGLAVDMAVAIRVFHLPHGFFLPMGFEYPFALLCVSLALVLLGPGRIAIADFEGRLFRPR